MKEDVRDGPSQSTNMLLEGEIILEQLGFGVTVYFSGQ